MYTPKIFCALIVFLMLSINANAQNTIPIKVNLSMPKKDISKSHDFTIALKITTSDPLVKIAFPYCFHFEYDIKNIGKSDAIFDVEEVMRNHYRKMPMNPEVSYHTGILCLDSTGKEKYDTLSIKNSVVVTHNIVPYYLFKKSKYRVRLKLYIPQSAGLKTKFIYTDWVYFNVMTSEVDYSDFGR